MVIVIADLGLRIGDYAPGSRPGSAKVRSGGSRSNRYAAQPQPVHAGARDHGRVVGVQTRARHRDTGQPESCWARAARGAVARHAAAQHGVR